MKRQLARESGSRKRSYIGAVLMVVVLLGVLAGTLPASAQAVYGSIYGTATDKTGAAIPNATITVTDVSKGTSVSVKSNESGLYRVQHLIPDTYKVEAEAPGYSKTLVNDVVVYADTAPEVNMQMAVGAVSSTVTVTGGAPLLETDRAEVSPILDARAALPILDGAPARAAATRSAADRSKSMASFRLPPVMSLTARTTRSRSMVSPSSIQTSIPSLR